MWSQSRAAKCPWEYTYDCLEDEIFRTKPDQSEYKKKDNAKSQQTGDNKFGSYELEDVRVVPIEAATRICQAKQTCKPLTPLDVDFAFQGF